MASAGLPGMRRGMTKLKLTAAHSVTTKNPSPPQDEPHAPRLITGFLPRQAHR